MSEPTPAAILGVRMWLAEVLDASRSIAAAPWTYLVVTPLGMPARSWLEGQLEQRGVRVEARRTIADWPRVSTALQVKLRDPEHIRRAVLFESAWREFFPRAAAEAWAIDPRRHARLAADKLVLRAGLNNLALSLGPRPDDCGVLHAFHLADEVDASAEARALEAALMLVDTPPAGPSLEDAIILAVRAHGMQRDRAGQPYIFHVFRVMMKQDSEIARIVAVLHDVVEDTTVSLRDLEEAGYGAEVCTAVDSLTRRPDEPYEDYVSRVMANPMACQVKLADLEDNMDPNRLSRTCESDLKRLARYKNAWKKLTTEDTENTENTEKI